MQTQLLKPKAINVEPKGPNKAEVTLEPFERTEPSSLARRTSLKAAAHGHTRVDEGEVTQPDLDGVTHIPEKQLPPRLE